MHDHILALESESHAKLLQQRLRPETMLRYASKNWLS